LLVVSTLDAVTKATEAEKAAADAVVDQIKAIGEVTKEDEAAIKTARAAYEALTQVSKDFVDRRVPSGTTTNINEEGALINYYDVLVA
ncbi:hypothetical protein, partial [Klebsiella pneumoniae]|uniref:hypothetical protein n=1 Tax=Klebsiella pneumoniae TaxID=573 RepID=UPI0025A1CA63